MIRKTVIKRARVWLRHLRYDNDVTWACSARGIRFGAIVSVADAAKQERRFSGAHQQIRHEQPCADAEIGLISSRRVAYGFNGFDHKLLCYCFHSDSDGSFIIRVNLLNRIVSLVPDLWTMKKSGKRSAIFQPNLIIGTFTDRFAAENPNQQYLAREVSGIFVLAQDLPVMLFPVVLTFAFGGGYNDSPGGAAMRR